MHVVVNREHSGRSQSARRHENYRDAAGQDGRVLQLPDIQGGLTNFAPDIIFLCAAKIEPKAFHVAAAAGHHVSRATAQNSAELHRHAATSSPPAGRSTIREEACVVAGVNLLCAHVKSRLYSHSAAVLIPQRGEGGGQRRAVVLPL